MQQMFTPRLMPVLLSLAFAGSAQAAGFQLQNQNASGTSVAFAGAAAVAEDASTIFFNPAGMTYLPQGHSISLGGTAIHRSVKFNDTGTSRMPVINPLTGAPTGAFHPLGDNGGNGGGTGLAPGMYYSYSVSDALRVGLGFSVTYGSETEYSDNFAGRFSGRYTSIHQLNLNPSVAYKINDKVSVGFGLNYAKSEIEFRQNAPFVGAPLGMLKGDDTAWGWNAGAMFQLSPQTRLGLSYRSTIKFDLEGKQTIAAPLNVDRGITAKLETPDTFSLALSQKIGDRLELLADATWNGWSSLKALEPMVGSARATAPLRYNFKDTWRFGLGAKYQLNDAWNLRAGIAFDQTPVPDEASRTMTVPDSDRTWLAFGARWKMNPNTSIDMGYAHIFFQDVKTARAVMNTTETATLQTVRGDFKTHAHLFSVQMNYHF
ncbi:outer membrane protein transport protein [Dechloromonas sp. ZY10]|uniref:OmpP1/FadL family transporter n=1 Tax=Dechloromonas aquae TaxID=2664436 RepID=UPI003527E9DF